VPKPIPNIVCVSAKQQAGLVEPHFTPIAIGVKFPQVGKNLEIVLERSTIPGTATHAIPPADTEFCAIPRKQHKLLQTELAKDKTYDVPLQLPTHKD
jgi:hypothetical protein